jgi:hypothetical protein
MAAYNQIFNSDDSVIRHVIIGLLADLNSKIFFYRQMDNTTRVAVDIPFYYSVTGDDQFLRDAFLFSTPDGANCTPDGTPADGNYDRIPRGVANLTAINIESSKLVNKRIRGNYSKLNDQGAMQSYTAEFMMIPVTMTMDIEVLVGSQIDSLKITEMILKKLYKSNYFYVEVGHLSEGTYKIASYYALPDDYTNNRPIDFTYDDKGKYKLTFEIQVNTFIPVFEFDTELHAGNRMFKIDLTVTNQNQATFAGLNPSQGDTEQIDQASLGAAVTSLPPQDNNQSILDRQNTP